jgi:sec-independent protein translocase protein TatA
MTGFLTPTHILLLLLVALLLFGAKRLPELGRSLGTGLREFKQSIDVTHHQEQTALPAAPTTASGVNRDDVTQPESTERPTAAGGAPSDPAA